MGWLLGLDGATEQLALALVGPGGAQQLRELPGGPQASAHLLPAVQALLQDAGIQPQDLLAIGFGQGPGAFTSLRAICAATQGLALGWGLPVLALDSLLLAVVDVADTRPECSHWGAVMDARMGELYVASFQRDADGWQPLMAPSLWRPESLRDHWMQGGRNSRPQALAGNGVQLLDLPDVPALAQRSRSQALARLLRQAWAQGPHLPADAAQPLYVRDRVALTTAEREAQRAGAAA